MYIEKINSPLDIKEMEICQLEVLAGEIRQGLMNRLSKRGGHFGPNFGFVEATIALHYVFNSPVDKFVLTYRISVIRIKYLLEEKMPFLRMSTLVISPDTLIQ